MDLRIFHSQLVNLKAINLNIKAINLILAGWLQKDRK